MPSSLLSLDLESVEMSEGRTLSTLAELCGGKGVYGLTASASLEPVGPKFLRTTDMIDGTIDWNTVPFCEVNDATAAKKRVLHGDLVISRTGANAGAAAYVSTPPAGAVFAGYLVRFRADPAKADSRFLGYVLQSRPWHDYVGNSRTGSAQPQFNAVLMGQFGFDCPSLPEQRRIANVLGALDDLIEANLGLINSLQQLRTAAWRGTRTAGRPVVFGEIAVLRNERVNPSQVSPETVHLGLEHFAENGGGLVAQGSAAGLDSQKLRFQSGDVLYGKLRPYFRKVARPDFDGVCSSEIWVFHPADGVDAEYLEWLASSSEFTEFAMKGSGGTHMPRARWDHVAGMPVSLPSPTEMERISDITLPMWQLMWSLTADNDALRRTRDELLPHLLSGRVSVREVAG